MTSDINQKRCLKDLTEHVSARAEFYARFNSRKIWILVFSVATSSFLTSLILAATGSIFYAVALLVGFFVSGLLIKIACDNEVLFPTDLVTVENQLIDLAHEIPELSSVLSPAISDIKKNRLRWPWYKKLFEIAEKIKINSEIEVSRPSFESVFARPENVTSDINVFKRDCAKNIAPVSQNKNIWRV